MRQSKLARAIAASNIDYERYRNDSTTQIPNNRGVVARITKDCDFYMASDLHVGHQCCYYEGIDELIYRVKSDRRNRVSLGGDQMEMEHPGHHDGGRDSHALPDKQIISFQRIFKPIAGQAVIMFSGNHGKHRFTRVQIDPDLIVAAGLNIPYTTVPTVIQLRTHKANIKIAQGHGKSGAQNWRAELFRMRGNFPGCDVYALGHTHDLVAEVESEFYHDKNGNEYFKNYWLARTGSFMLTPDYARYSMYSPKPPGFVVAKIRNHKLVDVEAVKL